MKRAILVVGAVLLLACGGPANAPAESPDSLSGSITVFAAASLTGAFKDEATAFEARHKGATVLLDFAGSAALATQINLGAPADVFASADLPNLQRVVAAGNSI